MDPASVATVIEDLEHFRDVWQGSLADPDIRRGAATIRRLLVENELGNAWRTLGRTKEPTLRAPNLELMLGSFDRSRVDCALAGGALYGGATVAGIMIVDGPTPPEPALGTNQDLIEFVFTLSAYMKSACAYVRGKLISRRDLVKYMANVKGGVHLASNSHSRKREQDLIAKVGGLEGRINHHSKDGLFFELLSIGQTLARSEDCLTMVTEFRRNSARQFLR